MERNLAVVLGMLVAYFFALLGMAFAGISYYRRKKAAKETKDGHS